MKKITRLLCCLTLFLHCCRPGKSVITEGERIVGDSLIKYSYQVIGFKTVSDTLTNSAGGTGFFIRSNNGLFFVTAKHVLNGCHGSSTKDPYQPNVMNIWLKNDGFPPGMIPIDASKIKDTSRCLPFTEDPDMIAIKINDSISQRINSVERFIRPPFDQTDTIEIFGFPGRSYVIDRGIFEPIHASNIRFTKGNYQFKRIVDPETHIADTINAMISSLQVKDDNSYQGYSGSPVFVRDARSKKWRIVGVFAGAGIAPTQTQQNILVVPLIDFVLDYIAREQLKK